jgi:two-component system LytT family response regulator
MPKCIVICDDPVAKQSITGFIEEQPGWNVASQVTGDQEAVSAIRRCQPDVCFMDVSVNGRFDIESVAEMVGNYKCLWVFISSYSQFAATAFELGAVDYVLRPFTPSRLLAALEKLGKRLYVKSKEHQQKLPVKSIDDVNLVNVDDIIWIGVSGDDLELHCENKMWLYRDTFVKLESQLDPAKFVRVHGRTLVNIKKVSSLKSELGEFSLLRLCNGDELKIDQRHRTPLFECLGL